ncbi:YqaJ-like viral recombinase domain containing protein, putative [Leishmania shawi]|uniref:YqaJ-like viral recombinase domain containing protein n=1 Tax=Leishmania shawi TaxID=5680 RepID=A0ABR3E1F2_9TRYP
MAQHPEKLKWKEAHPYGLSASQFGMALGFCGRVSDYVHYLRDIVGTEQEFTGNASTAHGINTEPKSRALYELLTGCRVYNGGFFVTDDRILGCSPDGQIYYHVDERPIEQQGALSASRMTASPSVCGVSSRYQRCSGGFSVSNDTNVIEQQRQRNACSVRVPFNSRWRPRSSLSTFSSRNSRSWDALAGDSEESTTCSNGKTYCATDGPSTTALAESRASTDQTLSTPVAFPSHHKVRLLEIKSPFRALYTSTKSGCQPFGIPLHYMCQIQGQLAIADCEECDFFVYLDYPVCQVEGWRVRRSRAFWAWAEPNLRCVSSWIRDGPPDWLNRSFAFTDFDFHLIQVVPLVFPFNITASAALTDARCFAFFEHFSNPFEALHRHREACGDGGAQASTRDGCFDYVGSIWAEITEYERIAATAQTPAVKHLFALAETDADDTGFLDSQVELCTRLSSWRRALEVEGLFEESATAVFWKQWICTAAVGRDPFVKVTLCVPHDWNAGRVVVRCTLPSLPRTQGDGQESTYDRASLPFHRRLFFVSLFSGDMNDPCKRVSAGASPGAAKPSPYATPLDRIPVFNESVTSMLKGASLACPVSDSAAMRVQVSSTVSIPANAAPPSR